MDYYKVVLCALGKEQVFKEDYQVKTELTRSMAIIIEAGIVIRSPLLLLRVVVVGSGISSVITYIHFPRSTSSSSAAYYSTLSPHHRTHGTADVIISREFIAS